MGIGRARARGAREEGEKGKRGEKVPVFNIPAGSRIPASPSLLTPATGAKPLVKPCIPTSACKVNKRHAVRL